MFDILKYREIKEFLKKNADYCQIVAISKNHPKESVLNALNSGVRIFGENRVNEARDKFSDLKAKYPDLQLHLTGPLQSNKVKLAASLFDVFHTLDREKIALEFAKYKDQIKKKSFFIQVNTGMEDNKSGIYINELSDFIDFCLRENELNIVGLMCIPPINDDPNIHFSKLQKLAKENKIDQISIGMSNDYLEAVKYSPTYIRLGSILFGKRK